jgi:hypothetical protein
VNCLDCSRDLDAQRPALAVCSGCGGAICDAHSLISYSKRPVGPGSGQSRMTSVQSRIIRCLVCVQAREGSVADQAARVLRASRLKNFWKRRAAVQASSRLGASVRPRIELDPMRPD